MLYMVTFTIFYHQYTPFMLAYIPAPWILWVIIDHYDFMVMTSWLMIPAADACGPMVAR